MRGSEPKRIHGDYSTPRPLVRYLVRSVDELLRTRLGKPAGLADAGVRLVDPAAGGMAFVLAAWRLAIERHKRAGGHVGALLREHLVPHFHGVELRDEGQARAVRSIRRFLRAAGCHAGDRADGCVLRMNALTSGPALAELRPNVLLGNPPWRGHSIHKGEWIQGLLQGYELPDGRRDEGWFRVDGEALAERNSKWLRDDYAKFLRLCQWLVDRNGEGIVALLLNHNFLEAPTFRALRRSLSRTFQEIYVLDLHGNSRKREAAPGGGRDENVFAGVAQGSAILLAVKAPGLDRSRIWCAELFGARKEKLAVLGKSSAGSTRWREVELQAPLHLFVRTDRTAEREFHRGLPLDEIFPVHSTGIITGRDRLVTALDWKTLRARLQQGRMPGADPRGIKPFLVRPFDVRFILYEKAWVKRPRRRVMRHLLGGDNIALIATRQAREPGAFVTRWLAGHKVLSGFYPNGVFPLFLKTGAERRPNLSLDLLRRLADRYGAEPAPEILLGYMYAVLSSTSYRNRYREQLQRSFPRIVFPAEYPRLLAGAELGAELMDLHLLRGPRLKTAIAATGLEALEDVRIGEYRVLPRWLRARRADEKPPRYARIAEALLLSLEVKSRIESMDV